MDFTGYITSVAELDYSQNGNPFYDIHIKTSIEKAELVRVMVRANPDSEASGSFNIRGNLHWTKEPVEIQVRKKPYSSGATMPTLVREGIIADITAHYPISIWSDHVNLPDDTWYTLTDVVIKNYQGKKLQTTPRTTVLQVSSEDTIDWATILPDIEKVEHPWPAKPSNTGNSTLQNVDITSVKNIVTKIAINEKEDSEEGSDP
eukprot:gene1579-1744_t